ncbi:UDP-glucose iridoid glucosyltransferase [Sesamum alatum]|uniref:Glycosyltransferase n=1 Tax=Sesamum alatum TaxID=300844 RepID=A0AAE2D094_9LAMI|nr:UDP-glucose iridoid glucosyltransferase [Sesamum alatum]
METSGVERRRRRRRVVLVPYPFQGHITPMLQLGSILHSKGFSILIAHTKFSSPNPSNYPHFTFLPLSDNLDGFDTSFHNLLNVMSVINSNCEAPFEEHMMQMVAEEEVCGQQVACIIYDPIMKFADAVANRLKLPSIVLRTTSAAYMHSHIVMFQLLAENLIPLPESQLHAAIPEVHPLRFKDLPLPASMEIPQVVLDFQHTTSATLDDFFSIGPFHKMAPAIPTSLLEEENICLSWLDKQAPNSVIYVSLGSLAIIDEKALTELAWGLAKSEQPFLWVVRPSLVNGSDAMESLPEDLIKTTQERGLVVKWAPQKKVLAHPAVGGFFTHCGWNSTLESICEGVPLICMPCFADQMVNARYLTYVWRVGIELENGRERTIEKAIRTMMVSEEGEVMRQRAFHMKREIERSMNEGGSSYESLNCLAVYLLSYESGIEIIGKARAGVMQKAMLGAATMILLIRSFGLGCGVGTTEILYRGIIKRLNMVHIEALIFFGALSVSVAYIGVARRFGAFEVTL